MAVTTLLGGSFASTPLLSSTFGGDRSGSESVTDPFSVIFSPAGGTAPTLTGFLKGTLVAAAGDILLAHATDPLQGMGDATYNSGFTVASSKLKLLHIHNTDATNSITIARAAANGLPIFSVAGDAVTIPAGGLFSLYLPAGTAALTTGSNDALTIAVSGGTPNATIIAAYGP